MPSRTSLIPGTRIADRFVIDHVETEGGMGIIYRASDALTGQPVAIKLLSVQTIERRTRALREVEVLSTLNCRSVVRYIAHETLPNGSLLLATEWLEGEDLAQALQRQALPLSDTLRLVAQVADALDVVHAAGWLHGDVKPANIFLDAGQPGRVVLIDFGIARPVASAVVASPTTAEQLMGTVSYLAPEIARGESSDGPAVDLFALGCVFYECLTGVPPFKAGSPSAVLARILFEQPDLTPGPLAALPPALLDLLLALLAKDPIARPTSAALVRRQLQQHLAQLTRKTPEGTNTSLPASLTTGEQRMVTLIVAWPSPTTALQPPSQAPSLDELRALFAPFAAQVEPLADGVMLVPSQLSTTEATDQAEQAVRCALMLKTCWRGAQVVVTTGRERLRRPPQLSEARERAAQLLREQASLSPRSSLLLDGLLLDETTARLVDLSFDITPVSASCFVIFAEQQRQDRSRLLLGKPTPCVGREHDLSVLESTLGHCLSEPIARLVLIQAPPGYGKSRLRQEFVHRVARLAQPLQVLFGRGDLMGVGSPFRMIASALRRLCGLGEREDQASQRQGLANYIRHRLPEADATRVTAFLGELCGLSFPVEYCPLLSGAHLSPRTMNAQITRAFIDLLVAELAVAPVLLLLEDIQWGDALSISLVQTALHELANHPLLVLGFGRPEFEELFPNICEDRSSFLLRLGKLGKRACLRLIKHALGEQVEPELCQRLIEQADGSALYLEELIRATATLQSGTQQPATVLAMLQARLMRLPHPQRRLLRAASVFGQSFDLEGLSELVGSQHSPETLDGWLTSLIEAELVEPAGDAVDGGHYRFRHALFHEAAYDLLTEQDRALGHRLAAQYLQAQGGRDPRLLAEHYRRGGSLPEASQHYLAAAERALGSSDLGGALDCVRQGLDCDVGHELQGALRAVELQAHFWRDEWAQALACGNQALQLLPQGSERWCRAAAVMLPTTSLLGHVENFAAIAQTLPACQPVAAARPAFMQAASYLLISTCLIGDREAAGRLLGLLRMQLSSSGRGAEAVELGLLKFGELVESRSFCSNPWQNYLLAEEATRITSEAGDLRTLLFVKAYLGAALLELGDLDAAKPVFEACLLLAERQREPLLATHVRVQHERWLLAMGHPPLVAQALQSAIRTVENPATNPLLLGEALANLAACRLAQGDASDAEYHARRACQALAGVPSEYLWALAVLLHTMREQQKFADAASLIVAGQAALQRCGGAYSQTLFLAAAAKLLTAAGEAEPARSLTHLAQQTVLRSAEYISAPAQRAAYLDRVAAHVAIRDLARLWHW